MGVVGQENLHTEYLVGVAVPGTETCPGEGIRAEQLFPRSLLVNCEPVYCLEFTELLQIGEANLPEPPHAERQ